MSRTENIDRFHATRRGRDFRIGGERMIGRLTAREFDVLDAIAANMRIGIEPLLISLARTLSTTEEALSRRLYSYRMTGLIERRVADVYVGENGSMIEIPKYVPTDRGTYLFAEALSLMDRGLVAA